MFKIVFYIQSFSTIAGVGSIPISKSLTLHNVLHVPNLSCNLLSISKLTHDLNCLAIFYSSTCKFQEVSLGRMIGSTKEIDGLYFFEDETQGNGLNSVSVNEDKKIMLWHCRLGHPSFLYLKYLFPEFFKNKNLNLFFVKFVNLQSIIVPLILLNLIKDLVHSLWFILMFGDPIGTLHQMEEDGFSHLLDDHTWWNQNLKLRTYSSIFLVWYKLNLKKRSKYVVVIMEGNIFNK